MSSKIPCLDLHRQCQSIKSEIFAALESVYDNTAFSGGPFVERFEKELATYCGTDYAAGLNSGTSALHLAMLALGIGKGDEVIVPANTFIATAWGPSYAGATPVFVDCHADTWNIDAAEVEKAITPRTKAIIGVHLYGQAFDIEPVRKIADQAGVYLVEDCAQAQGALYKGTRVGGLGAIGCFSFYPGKNLGALGEAGAVVANEIDYIKRIQSLRSHGATVRYYHDEIGYNMRMDGFHAAALSVKLKYLDGWNRRRREIAHYYQSNIENSHIQLQMQPDWAESVYHLFVVQVPDRQQFLKHMEAAGIYCALHYPVPCHRQKAYAELGYRDGSCPNAEYLAEHCVSLPMYPEMTDAEIARVVTAINRY